MGQNKPVGLDLANLPTSDENTAKFLAFVEWLTEHPKFRVPKTAKEWADENGVTERTLYNWRNKPEVINEIRRRRERYVENHMPEITRAAVITAKIIGKEGAADRKLLWDWVHGNKEGVHITQNNINVTNTQNNVNSMSNDRLAEMLVLSVLEGTGLPPAQVEAAKKKMLADLVTADDDLSSLGRGTQDAEFVEIPRKNERKRPNSAPAE